MKKVILALSLYFLFVPLAFACTCGGAMYAPTNYFYTSSDFVGIVLVQKAYDSPTKKSRYYKIKVKPKTVFKGKAPTYFKVYGNKGHKIISSCDIGVRQGETWLIYAEKDEDGDYAFGFCSFPELLKAKTGKKVHLYDSEKRDLKQLKFLSHHVPKLNRDYTIVESSDNLSNYLAKYDGQEFDKSSAQYLITFSSDFDIKSIQVLRGFSNKFNRKLINFIKDNTTWSKGYLVSENVKSKDTIRHVFGIYYYHEDKKFLSVHDL